jgi:type I restriction enzyme, S subunit
MASSWIHTTIGDQVTLQRGIDITRAEQRRGKVPVISSGGTSSYHDTAGAKGPGVVLGRKGVVGSVYYVASDYWPHDTTLWVKDFHGNHPRFVFYFFKAFALRLASMNVGSANPTLNRNHVHPIKILWPTRLLQNQIADILGSLDDKIELNHRTNMTLEAMARALFQSWFVDFAPVRLNESGRQFSVFASLFPESFQASTLGKIPKDWRTTTLGEVLSTIETGGRPKGGVASILEGVPSVGAESIVGLGRFDYGKTKFISREFFQAMNRGHVQDGDVLLYKDGGRPGEFEPHVTMVGDDFPFPEFAINEHVYRLRTGPVPQCFLYFWLSSDNTMDEMRNRGTGVAIPGLNSTAVRELPIILAPPQILNAFEEQVSPLLHRIFANCNESRTLTALRDAVLPKLLSGDVSVSEIPIS